MQSLKRMRVALAGAVMALAAAPVAAQDLPTGAQLLERYAAAIGGENARAEREQGQMVMEMSVQGMTMTMDMRWQGESKRRVTMTTPMGEMSFGVNGDVYWSIDPMQGAKLLSKEEAEQVSANTGMGADLLAPGKYPTLETVERTEMAGTPCYKVRAVDTDGQESFHCFAVDTGLLVASTIAAEGMEVVLRFEDYRDFEGVKHPTRMVTQAMGQEVVATLKSASRAPQPDSAFELPAEVRALLPKS